MATQEQNVNRFTGDRDRFERYQQSFEEMLHDEGAATGDAALIALAIRAGLAEIAVEVSSVRGFGVGQQRK